MSTSIGLPSLSIAFRRAAQEIQNRQKRGFVGLILRDTAAQGLHSIPNAAAIPEGLGETNKASIRRALQGSERGTPSKVIVSVIDPTDDTNTALLHALTALSSQPLDYFAPPEDVDETELQTIVAWVKEQRAAYRTVKAVLPKTAGDHRGIIHFASDGIEVGTQTFTAAQYCGRIAGILAGVPSDSSATYITLPEVSALPALSRAEAIAAIDAGKLILQHDGSKAKIARAVNSLTSIPPEGKEDWRKIKIVEGMDLVTYFLRTTIEDAWLGRYANSYDNKLLLVVAITTFLQDLEAGGVLQRGSSTVDIDTAAQEQWLRAGGIDTSSLSEQQLREADTGSWVFLCCAGRFLDATEDFQILFDNL